jgi:hypothetical protein
MSTSLQTVVILKIMHQIQYSESDKLLNDWVDCGFISRDVGRAK